VESPHLPTTDLVFHETLKSRIREVVMRSSPNLDGRPNSETLVPHCGRERGMASEQLEEDGLNCVDPVLMLSRRGSRLTR